VRLVASRFLFYYSAMSKLYVVSTPIGNLGDITLRAQETLRLVDLVLAEDTRVTGKLLSHFGIRKPMVSYHEHSKDKVGTKVLDSLENGKDIALVTDAGTPGISDPGRRLISLIVSELASVEIIPIPGPSALSAIISVSDIDLEEYLFLGFPPHKKGRRTFFERVESSEIPVILFESPHRILKTFSALKEKKADRYVNVGRELTKIHEEIFRGTVSDAEAHFVGEKQRGEFVIVVK
jgi:16S rRNA (cytidine1402-2'-O)-methyltransferase